MNATSKKNLSHHIGITRHVKKKDLQKFDEYDKRTISGYGAGEVGHLQYITEGEMRL